MFTFENFKNKSIMANHTFTLPSGVEAETTELEGKHQRILTEQTGKNHADKLNELLAALLVRVGSVKNPSVEFVGKMLSADRKWALIQARQFSMDFDPTFKFKFPYASEDGGIKQEAELEVNLEEGFVFTPYRMRLESGRLVECVYGEYADIERTRTIELPKSGDKVTFTLLDAVGEKHAQAIPKNQRSSHSSILLRNPVVAYKTESDTVPIKLDLDKMKLKDIEALRTAIKECEAQLDTEIMFAHPEADKKPQNQKEVVLDLLGTVAFFYPSEAI